MGTLSFLSAFSVPGAVFGAGVQGMALPRGADVLQGSEVPEGSDLGQGCGC